MSLMDWNDRLDIGVKEMNDEHKVLLKYMNELHDLCEKKASEKDISVSLDNLAKYTEKHFKDEEAYLESIKYADCDLHKTIHADLLKKLSSFHTQFKQKGVSALNFEFFVFLKTWLSAHIQGIDMKYGKFAKGKAA